MKVAAVVVAAGYGTFKPEEERFPKVLESVQDGDVDRPMLVEVIKRVKESGIDRIIVVVNPRFRQAISKCLIAHGLNDLAFVLQPWRTGAAGAVSYALPLLQLWEITDFLVVYGDMPLFSRDTITRLIDCHQLRKPAISMVSVKITGKHPRELERYGRILRKGDRIIGIVEPGDATSEQLEAETVNPSLYIFRREWFEEALNEGTKPRDKGDSRPHEFHLPPLVGYAVNTGQLICEVTVQNKEEALGVNTARELDEVRAIVAKVAKSLVGGTTA